MGRNLFFDLGDLHALPARPVLRVSHAFVSHAHVDHFCGFDTIVRYALGRRKTFRVVGPPGIGARVEGKLRGYTWNLVESYAEAFVVEALEWGEERGTLWRFPCRDGFPRQEAGAVALPEVSDGVRVVHAEPAFRVLAAQVDHQTPCLAYALEEPFHVNVSRSALDRLGLAPGPWVRRLKEAVFRDEPPDVRIPVPESGSETLGTLRNAGAVLVTEGQKVVYVVDCAWREPGASRLVELARGAHLLYCEAAFLEEDAARARDRFHLTAGQAGELAKKAGVGALRLFHFSPKYRGRESEFLVQAREAFGGEVAIGA
jgi:ribonuclease Z